jgi:hypothetical protein
MSFLQPHGLWVHDRPTPLSHQSAVLHRLVKTLRKKVMVAQHSDGPINRSNSEDQDTDESVKLKHIEQKYLLT